MRLFRSVVIAVALALVGEASAVAAPVVGPYGQDDGGGFRDVLAAAPQLSMYQDLMYGTSRLRDADLGRFFKDSTFGVAASAVAGSEAPRADVTIVRDSQAGLPHVYGATRQGAMFGLGYVAAEDRLFVMDVLRHAGRAQLSSFLGGSYQAADAEVWRVAPYTEADLTRQAAPGRGFRSELLVSDMDNYLAGVNQFIAETRLDPAKLPAAYGAIGRPQGPEDWRREDIVATSALVGAFAGAGGGDELAWASVYDALRRRFGRAAGRRAFDGFRAVDPAGATATVPQRFPGLRLAGTDALAIPDTGSLQAPAAGAPLLPLATDPTAAVAVPARASRTRHGLMVGGVGAGYFAPSMLIEQDVHAPATGGQPGIDARGVAVAGLSFYVQFGRGRDFAWSGSPSGQDITDTFAVDLCEPSGAPATLQSTSYVYRGGCLPMEPLTTTNAWQPTAWDATPAGAQTLSAQRTALGVVVGRATLSGKPVAYTRLRSTYTHDLIAAYGFQELNEPAVIQSADDFIAAADRTGYAFNWVYSDPDEIAYATSGRFPLRARGVNPDLPIRALARFQWRGWDPGTWASTTIPHRRLPHVVDPPSIATWGNRPSPGWRGAGETSVGRVDLLDAPLRRALRKNGKLSLADLVKLTSVAGSTDLRAHSVLPLALRVIGTRGSAASALRAWLRDGALRRDADHDGFLEHAHAIAIFDAWWPLWIEGEFRAALGGTAFDALRAAAPLDGAPDGGSWPGYVQDDLTRVLNGHRAYCGVRARCRRMLQQTLTRAAAASGSEYEADEQCRDPRPLSTQACHYAIVIRPLPGGATTRIPWIDRPTYQQAVSVRRRIPAPSPLCGPVRDVAPSRTALEDPPPLVIGDSVLVGAVNEVAAAGFEADAHNCRKMKEGLEDLQARALARTLPRLVVLALGTSGPVRPDHIEQALRILGPGRRLALVTPRENFPTQPSDADVMREAARRHPDRITLLDWVAASAGQDSWFVPDKVHLTPEGAGHYAAFLSTAL